MGFEWGRMIENPNAPPYQGIMDVAPDRWIFAIVMPLAVLAFSFIPIMRENMQQSVLTLSLMVFLFFIFDKQRRWANIGLLYLLFPALAAIWLRGSGVGFEDEGFKRVFFVIMIVIAADAGAYFSGKSIGGPKLAPRLSPKKTWAGFIGGLIIGALLGGVLAELWSDDFFDGLIVGAVLVVAAVFGDFLESGFKRKFGVKDTGGLIPGHGGLLDRTDSHMIALCVAALVIWLAPGLSPI